MHLQSLFCHKSRTRQSDCTELNIITGSGDIFGRPSFCLQWAMIYIFFYKELSLFNIIRWKKISFPMKLSELLCYFIKTQLKKKKRITWPHMFPFISEIFILFCLSICLFFHQHYIVLITIALLQILKLGNINLSTLFFWKTDFAILM